ncbi:MAG TPA: hypothetical protein DC000_05125 [Clostridiales bacterium]|nr:hypothetical protein [Clostridiales bacterium]
MERAFIVSKESKYHKELDQYCEFLKEQRVFINKFFQEKGIEAEAYRVGGSGGINCTFDEWKIKDIYLNIVPTESDIIKFDKMLCKADEHGARRFKVNCEIAKDFAQKCIDEKIVINVHEPWLRDYFKILGFRGFSFSRFEYEGKLYLKINADDISGNVPDGFVEIKLSEFYANQEKLDK